MSRRGKGARGAIAGLGLAAAGALYSRLGGGKRAAAAAPADPQPSTEPLEEGAPSAEVERARSELADELARRARSG